MYANCRCLVGSGLVALCLIFPSGLVAAAEPLDFFKNGEGIELAKAIPANERGILCLAADMDDRIFGGTTGRAAHLFVFDPVKKEVKSLVRLEGGIGFSHAMILLSDGTIIAGTQTDPTGIAVQTDPKAVGHLYRFLNDKSDKKLEDLGVPVPGQGIYTLAHLAEAGLIVGNTWPDGHFFSYDLKEKKFTDHGAIAGYHTFETPQQAKDINQGTDKKVNYPRQVSRAIVVDPATGAYTAGADGFLYRFDSSTRKLDKLPLQFPAATGRESWSSLEVAVIAPRNKEGNNQPVIYGGTSEGYLIELRIADKDHLQLRPRGQVLGQAPMQALSLLANPEKGSKGTGSGETWTGHTMLGIAGHADGMPRAFRYSQGASTAAVLPGGIPQVDGQPSMVGFGALVLDNKGHVYGGERDRIARLVRFSAEPRERPRPQPVKEPEPSTVFEPPARLPCNIVFAPEGTTTDGSGYTALQVGKDGQVYVGTARYGDYAWLLRFDPAAKPLFMDKVVNMKQLTGEHLKGINTQGKIHAKIVVGADGKIWFASKQAHEVFDTRPEYGDYDGYPGGHLCYFDPKTGFSRTVGILKKQEGVMGGVIDDAHGRLYYRSEPKNDLLVYDIKTGDVLDRGHVGAAGRYMAIDSKGAVYTIGRGDTLCHYDPETGYVEDLAIKVEGDGGYTAPYVIAIGPNGKLYGAGTNHPWIMEFDIDRIRAGAFPEVTMRNAAPAAPPGMTPQDIHAGVFGKDGHFYFPLLTTGPLEKGGKPQQHLRIMRFDPAGKKCETVGIPDTSSVDEDKVKHVYVRKDKYRFEHMQGAAVGADGTLYLMAIYPQLNVACFPGLTKKQ